MTFWLSEKIGLFYYEFSVSVRQFGRPPPSLSRRTRSLAFGAAVERGKNIQHYDANIRDDFEVRNPRRSPLSRIWRLSNIYSATLEDFLHRNIKKRKSAKCRAPEKLR